MQENVNEVEMLYIQHKGGSDYSVETAGRRTKGMKLNFTNVEGIEINASRPLELKNSFLQLGAEPAKIWNMRFAYPTNLSIRYTGKILIEVI